MDTYDEHKPLIWVTAWEILKLPRSDVGQLADERPYDPVGTIAWPISTDPDLAVSRIEAVNANRYGFHL